MRHYFHLSTADIFLAMAKSYPTCRLGSSIIKINDKPYHCQYCGKSFVDIPALETHKCSHKESKQYYCNICKKQFAEQNSYDQHISSHSIVTQNNSISSKKNGKLHVNIQKNEDTCKKMYTCSECKNTFPTKGKMRRHRRSAHKPFGSLKVNHVCLVCNKTLKGKHEYDEHILSHSEASHTESSMPSNRNDEIHANVQQDVDTCEKPYTCIECNKKYSFENNLKRHMRSAHKSSFGSMEVNHECFVCNNTFKRKHEYDDHILSHSEASHTNPSNRKPEIHANTQHDVDTCEKPYICSECNKKFRFETNLKRHMRWAHKPSSDSMEVNHVCFVCNTIFKEKCEYDEHILAHSKVTHSNGNINCNKKAKIHANIVNNLGTCEKPYSCGKCDKKYLFENNLKRHMLSAHKLSDSMEVKHVCFVCNIAFSEKHKYDEHILSHTGTKIYICSRCRKPFSSTSELNEHICIEKGEIVLPEES